MSEQLNSELNSASFEHDFTTFNPYTDPIFLYAAFTEFFNLVQVHPIL